MVAKGEEVGEEWIESLGLADANYYIEWINNKVLLYSTRELLGWPKGSFGFSHKMVQKPERTFWPAQYIQYPVLSHNGKEPEKE